MAIAFRAATSAGNAGGTSLTVNKPAGVVADDVQILIFYMEHGTGGDFSTVSVSGGATWTLVHQTFQGGPGGAGRFSGWTFIQKAGGSEPASYSITWTGSGSFWRTGLIGAFSGVDTTTQQDTTATEQASATSSVSVVGPSLTTVTNGAMIVHCTTNFDGRAISSLPSGSTPTFSSPSGSFFGTNSFCIGELTTAGATGDKTLTLSSASWNTGQMLALRPAGGAATKAPPPFRQPYAHLIGR